MTTQNYLMIQSDVVTNVCIWDGNPDDWTPPADATMVVQADIPAFIWTPIVVDKKVTDWELTEVIGSGDIGFTWDGSVLTTNQPKPVVPN